MPVGDECRPILRNGFDCSRPGMPVSSTNCTTLRSAGGLPSSSLQMNTIVSAYGPFVMKVFEPFSTYSSPSRRAVACIDPNASLPEFGSVIAHAPILSSVSRSSAHRSFCAIVPFDMIAAAVSPTDTPMRGDHARRALAELDDRQQREAAATAAATRAARPSCRSSRPRCGVAKESRAIESMPNVLYSLRSRSYGGRSPCSSSSRCGRISLSTNWRTASRIICSSSGHSYMARIVRAPTRPVREPPVRQRPCRLHADVVAEFQRCNTHRRSWRHARPHLCVRCRDGRGDRRRAVQQPVTALGRAHASDPVRGRGRRRRGPHPPAVPDRPPLAT